MAGIKVTDLPVLGAAAPEDVMYIVDTSTNTSKQIAVEDLNVIPLDGTATGAPITGDLQVKDLDGESFKLFYNDSNSDENGLYFETTDQTSESIKVGLITNGSDGTQAVNGVAPGASFVRVVNSSNETTSIGVGDGQITISVRSNQLLVIEEDSIGFFNKAATPSVQAAAIADPTDLASLLTALPALLAALRAYGIIAE